MTKRPSRRDDLGAARQLLARLQKDGRRLTPATSFDEVPFSTRVARCLRLGTSLRGLPDGAALSEVGRLCPQSLLELPRTGRAALYEIGTALLLAGLPDWPAEQAYVRRALEGARGVLDTRDP